MNTIFDISGRAAVVTGGGGVLGRSMAEALASAGARVAVLGRTTSGLEKTAEAIRMAGGACLAVQADVMDEGDCRVARDRVIAEYGRIDILVNAAGGASPSASTETEQIMPESGSARTVLDLSLADFRATGDLNFLGTFIPTQAFLEPMVKAGSGSVVNIASMGAEWPLTRSPAYSAGKAAVVNYTKWLAMHTARCGIRVNAISPGFFLTTQNRFLLVDRETGQMTPRGRKILDGTPMNRFGEPDELNGALLWLASGASSFVTGAVIPVDGGFGAYGGV